MEDQLSALGLALNCIVLWNTVYMDRALAELRAQGYPVLAQDVPRLSPFVRHHISIDGHYSFHLAETSAVLTDRCATRTPKTNRHRPLAVPRLSVTEGLLGHADLAQDRADEAGDRAQVTS